MKKILTILLFNMFCNLTIAQTEGELYQIKGTNTFVAAVATSKFQYYVAVQKYDNWCWAACTQMVLNYQGVSVTQNDVVFKAFGRIVNKPAGCEIITKAANGWDHNGTTIEAFAAEHISAQDMVDALAHKYPLIIGLNMPGQNVGHAYVLTAIYFQLDQNDDPLPLRVTLRDPWPDNPSKTSLSWTDFKSRINCIVHVTY